MRVMRAAQTKEAFCEAEAALRSLGAFRDAAALADQCRERAEVCRKDAVYAAALWHMERKSVSGYISAGQLFDSIPGWKDADAQAAASRAGIERLRQESERAQAAARRRAKILRRVAVVVAALIPVCVAAALLWRQAVVPRLQYNQALALLEQGEYVQAWSLLENLDVRDSAERRAQIREELVRRADVGSRVLFGAYEQDGNAENGAEDILWRVLARDGDSFLLLSEYGLDIQPYQKPGHITSWEECGLRSWLNGAFFDEAFRDGERESILAAPVSADPNPTYAADPGADTEDRLFLLSVEEAYRFLPTDGERQCFATPYAKELPAFASRENGRTWWWLRTPGRLRHFASLVLDSGEILEDGYFVCYAYITVRPAMWVRLPGAGA